MTKNSDELVLKLKTAMVPPEKKWMYNFAAQTIKLYESNASYEEFQINIALYYKQHYEHHYTKLARKFPLYKKKKLNQLKKSQCNIYARDRQNCMNVMFKMFREGKISQEDTEKIKKKIKETTGLERLEWPKVYKKQGGKENGK